MLRHQPSLSAFVTLALLLFASFNAFAKEHSKSGKKAKHGRGENLCVAVANEITKEYRTKSDPKYTAEVKKAAAVGTFRVCYPSVAKAKKAGYRLASKSPIH
jgi:hypothetical protein